MLSAVVNNSAGVDYIELTVATLEAQILLGKYQDNLV